VPLPIAHVALWRVPPAVYRLQEGSIPFVRATGCSLAAKAPVWETGDRGFEFHHPDQFYCPCADGSALGLLS
jgi:hypothetical protein